MDDPQVGQALTLDQIEVLLAVVDHGSFTAAARALKRTQGGVSYHVQRLEEQLGIAVFDRSGRRPRLTEAGAVVVREAEAIRADLRRLRQVAAGLGRGLEARVLLAMDVLFDPTRLAALLRAFQLTFPSVDVAIETGIADEPAERVRGGAATLCVGPTQAAVDLTAHPCGTLDLVLVVAPDHPLARLDRPVAVEDLRRYPNLVLPTRESSRPFVRSTHARLRRWRVADSYMRHELVRGGAGWSRLPRHQIAGDLAAGRLVVPDLSALPEGLLQVPLSVAYHPERPPGPAGRWWVERLRSA